MRVCLGVCDKSNSGEEAVTLLFLKSGERVRQTEEGSDDVGGRMSEE